MYTYNCTLLLAFGMQQHIKGSLDKITFITKTANRYRAET
jgi:hypothetical protein